MPTFKITIAYDGTDFVGWQRQESGISIQGLLEESVRRLEDGHVTVTGAGRTDAGVHALGQVASFTIARRIDPSALARALNANLPASVRVMKAEETVHTFHARFDATCKAYRYRISNREVLSPFDRGYAWHIRPALDVEAMRAAAALIVGRHDFSTFQAAGSSPASTVREVFSSRLSTVHSDPPDVPDLPASPGQRDLSDPPNPPDPPDQPDLPDPRDRRAYSDLVTVQRDHRRPGLAGRADSLILYDISGNGFLRHMVRNIVGSLVEIGRGRQPVAWMTEILDGRDRRLAGPTAPASGLVLVAVEYGGTITAKDPVHVP